MTTKPTKSTLRPWTWITIVAVSFTLGFIPQYFRAARLENEATQSQGRIYSLLVESQIHTVQLRLSQLRLFNCQGKEPEAGDALAQLFAGLRDLQRLEALGESKRDQVAAWLVLEESFSAKLGSKDPRLEEDLLRLDGELSTWN